MGVVLSRSSFVGYCIKLPGFITIIKYRRFLLFFVEIRMIFLSNLALDRTMTALLLILPVLSIAFTRGLNRGPSLQAHQSSLLAFPLVSGAVFLYMPDSEIKKALLAASQALMIFGIFLLPLLKDSNELSPVTVENTTSSIY